MEERTAYIASRYGLAGPVRELRTAHRGAVGQIFRLDTVSGSFAVKELFWSAAEADVVREARFRDAAAQRGIRAPAALRTVDGSYVARLPDNLGGKCVRVYTWIDGTQASGSEADIWLAGTLGKLHAIDHPSTDAVDEWYWKPPTDAEIGELIERSARADAFWTAELREGRTGMRELAGLAARLPDQVIMCHRDMQAQNVVRTDAGYVLVDWDEVGPAPPDWELATVLYRAGRDGVRDLLTVYRAAGGTATISSLDQFTWVIATSLNYVRAQVEVALDSTGPMRDFAERELDRILSALPTAAGLAELRDLAARCG